MIKHDDISKENVLFEVTKFEATSIPRNGIDNSPASDLRLGLQRAPHSNELDVRVIF